MTRYTPGLGQINPVSCGDHGFTYVDGCEGYKTSQEFPRLRRKLWLAIEESVALRSTKRMKGKTKHEKP